MKVIRSIISILLLWPLIFSFAIQFEHTAHTFSLHQPQIWFWGAFVTMFLISLIFIKQASYVSILKHELCHNLFAILTFHKPVALHVSAGKGGEFHHTGNTNIFMVLAPYFFPLLSGIMMLVSLFDIRAHTVFLTFLGLACSFDLSTAIKDTHLKQPDLRQYGLLFSMSFVSFLALILYGMLAAYVAGGYSASGTYFVEGFTHSWQRLSEILKLLH